MKPITRTNPTVSEIAPARIESAPSSGPTLRSSTTVSGAGRAPARSSTARSLAEAAGGARGECPPARAAPAGDRLPDDRCADHLAIEHDGEAMIDVGSGHVSK